MKRGYRSSPDHTPDRGESQVRGEIQLELLLSCFLVLRAMFLKDIKNQSKPRG